MVALPASQNAAGRRFALRTCRRTGTLPSAFVWLDALPLKDAVASYVKTPLLAEPGTAYRYSNAGINTAGRIIEVVGVIAYKGGSGMEAFTRKPVRPAGRVPVIFRISPHGSRRCAPESHRATPLPWRR